MLLIVHYLILFLQFWIINVKIPPVNILVVNARFLLFLLFIFILYFLILLLIICITVITFGSIKDIIYFLVAQLRFLKSILVIFYLKLRFFWPKTISGLKLIIKVLPINIFEKRVIHDILCTLSPRRRS